MSKWRRPSGVIQTQTSAPVEGELIEPTKDEAKNGWTAETLTAYVNSRKAPQSGKILMDPMFRQKPKPQRANNDYRPIRGLRG